MAAPDKLTESQIEFARQVAKGRQLVDAYAIAFAREKDATSKNNASRLWARLDIKQLVAQIREEAAKDFSAEISWNEKNAMREAEEAMELARSLQQPGTMVNAIKLKAQIKGIISDKKKDEAPQTQEEVEAQIEEFLSRIPAELLLKAYQEAVEREAKAAPRKPDSADFDKAKFSAPGAQGA